MKYRKEIYEKALASLAELRETLKEDQTPVLDFIAEAVAEKGDRDHPAPPEPLTQEQLREMVGHWVWVLVNYDHNGKAFQCDGWALVATPCRIAYLDQEFPVSELGTRFQAYTQPVSDFRVRLARNTLCTAAPLKREDDA